MLSIAAKARLLKAAAAEHLQTKSLGATLPLDESDQSSGLPSPRGRVRTARLSNQSSSKSDSAAGMFFCTWEVFGHVGCARTRPSDSRFFILHTLGRVFFIFL